MSITVIGKVWNEQGYDHMLDFTNCAYRHFMPIDNGYKVTYMNLHDFISNAECESIKALPLETFEIDEESECYTVIDAIEDNPPLTFERDNDRIFSPRLNALSYGKRAREAESRPDYMKGYMPYEDSEGNTIWELIEEGEMTGQFREVAKGVSAGAWNISFANPETRQDDETQLDLADGEGAEELWGMWSEFCKENGWDAREIDVDLGEADDPQATVAKTSARDELRKKIRDNEKKPRAGKKIEKNSEYDPK